MPTKILFLAANPQDTTHLQLGAEIRLIDESLRKTAFRDAFDLEQAHGVRPVDLQEAIVRHSPGIVHFSGHGSKTGKIILQNDQHGSHPVSAAALSDLFRIFQPLVQCVVLNACYSQSQAEAIVQYVPCVVGMSRAIGDDAALRFAQSFYMAIGNGKSIQTAFDLGRNLIDLTGLNEQDTPQLRLQQNVSAAAMFFVGKPSAQQGAVSNNTNTISDDLYWKLYNAFLACDEFQSDESLRAVFSAPSLQPFVRNLRSAGSPRERVTTTLNLLQKSRHRDGRTALIIFVESLRDGRDPQSDDWTILNDLYQQL